MEQDEKNDYILRKYPQYSEDFEMPKYRFKKNIFIDGSNVMESSEWDILKILKKDTVLEYVLNMRQNKDIYDTLSLFYNKKDGFLFLKTKNKSKIVLIDSLHQNSVKIINTYIDEERQ